MKSGNSKNLKKKINGKYIFIKKFSKEREFYFYQEYFNYRFLSNLGFENAPKIIGINKLKFELYFEFIENHNKKLTNKSEKYELITIKLIKEIQKQKIKPKLYAKEALLNCTMAINQVLNRISEHKNNFSKFNSEYHLIINKFEKLFRIQKKYLIKLNPTSNLTFSQADSSINNSLIDKNERLYLVDFEYAGLDSPIKQHIDYLLHPKNCLFTNNSKTWSEFFLNALIEKGDQKNINIYNSFFALKWGLIVLNEFLPKNWEVRLQADMSKKNKYDKILMLQLKKAKLYLEASKKLLDDGQAQKLFTESERILLFKSY